MLQSNKLTGVKEYAARLSIITNELFQVSQCVYTFMYNEIKSLVCIPVHVHDVYPILNIFYLDMINRKHITGLEEACCMKTESLLPSSWLESILRECKGTKNVAQKKKDFREFD